MDTVPVDAPLANAALSMIACAVGLVIALAVAVMIIRDRTIAWEWLFSISAIGFGGMAAVYVTLLVVIFHLTIWDAVVAFAGWLVAAADPLWIRFPLIGLVSDIILTLIIGVGAAVCLIHFLRCLLPHPRRPNWKRLWVVATVTLVTVLAGWLLILSANLLFPSIAEELQVIDDFINRWLGLSAFWLAVVLQLLLLVWLLRLIFLQTASMASLVRIWLRQWREARMHPDEWGTAIRIGSPLEQAMWLNFGSPERLGITIDELLRRLEQLRDSVTADPALSAYHAKWSELLDVSRQARAG